MKFTFKTSSEIFYQSLYADATARFNWIPVFFSFFSNKSNKYASTCLLQNIERQVMESAMLDMATTH